jgi:hypothetical protein
LVIRAPRGPTESFEWGSASSGGRIADETLMASEFGKAVLCATGSVNEGHRHQLQPLQRSFGYQQLQGQDTGAKRGKTLVVSAYASCFRWTAFQNRSQSPCHPQCPSEGPHRVLSRVHCPSPCKSSHAGAHQCCLHVAVARPCPHSANDRPGASARDHSWQSRASPYVDRRAVRRRRRCVRLHLDTNVQTVVLQSPQTDAGPCYRSRGRAFGDAGAAEQRVRGGRLVVDYDVNCVRRHRRHFAPHPVFVYGRKSSVCACGAQVCVSA